MNEKNAVAPRPQPASPTINSTPAAPAAQLDLVAVRLNEGGRYPRIHSIPIGEARSKMWRIVTDATLYRGNEVENVNVSFVANHLLDELLADEPRIGLRFLTFEEIAWTIKRAVLGQGRKELHGINVGGLYAALVDYARHEGMIADKKAAELKRRSASKNVAFDAIRDAYAGALVKSNQ